MKQVFAKYTEWEDYKNGMYSSSCDNELALIEKSKLLLSNPCLFFEVANKVINEWPISTAVNLTNNGINKRAWLGQASCSYLYSVPEVITRKAWMELSDAQRFQANTVAQSVIDSYEK